MRNLRTDMRFAGNPEHLVQRRIDLRILMTHVARINAVERGDHLGQLNNLIRLREHAGLINEARREAHRAVLHGLLEQRLHLLQFLSRGRPIKVAPHALRPHVVMPDERRHVHRHVRLLHVPKELPHVQSGQPAVADNDGSYAHPDEVLRFGHGCHIVGVSMDVNEPRGHDQALGLDFSFGIAGDSADRCDAPILDGHIGEERRVARTVDHPAMADDDVVGLGIERKGKQCSEQADGRTKTMFHGTALYQGVMDKAIVFRTGCSHRSSPGDVLGPLPAVPWIAPVLVQREVYRR